MSPSNRQPYNDYMQYIFLNFVNSVLLTQMPINASNAVTLAHQVRSYTLEAAGFTDTVDVLYVAQMMHKFMDYVTELREVSRRCYYSAVYILHHVFVSLHTHALLCPSCPRCWLKWAVT